MLLELIISIQCQDISARSAVKVLETTNLPSSLTKGTNHAFPSGKILHKGKSIIFRWLNNPPFWHLQSNKQQNKEWSWFRFSLSWHCKLKISRWFNKPPTYTPVAIPAKTWWERLTALTIFFGIRLLKELNTYIQLRISLTGLT